jgi:hypothetical protein
MCLKVGEVRTVPLSSLAMAGYRWSGFVEGPDPGAVTLQVRLDELSSVPRAGESAAESAVLLGIRPGRAVVRLEQRRPWEHDQPPADVIGLHVKVSGRPLNRRDR